MKKEFFGILICMLMCATAFSVATTANIENTQLTSNASLSTVDGWPMINHDAANTRVSDSPAPETNQTFMKKNISDTITIGEGNDLPVDINPAVVNGGLFFQISCSYNMLPQYTDPDKVYQINAATGSTIRKTTLTGGTRICSIVFDNDNLYLTRGTELVCLNAADQSAKWVFPARCFSPVIANGKIYFATEDKLYGVNTDGTEAWNFTPITPFMLSSTVPTIVDEKVYFVASAGGAPSYVYCLDANNGSEIWNYMLEYNVNAPSVVVDGKVIISADDYGTELIICLDATGHDGTTDLLWSVTKCYSFYDNFGMCIIPSFAVVNNRVYGSGASFDTGLSMVYCIDANNNGTEIWNYSIADESGILTNPSVADGKLYICSQHAVYCLDANGIDGGSTVLIWSYSYASTSPDPSRERFMAPIIGGGKIWVCHINFIRSEIPPYGYSEIYIYGLTVYGFGPQNHAPATPGAPSGPSEGMVGQELTFTASTTDPDAGDLLWYSFSWGDGSSKDWIGPYESGVTVTQKHTWSNGGSFAVKVEAKDFFTVTPSSVQLPVKIYQTTLEIGSITGGTSVSSEVKNTGTLTGSNINWTITVKGGFLGLINVEKTGGPISAIAAGGSSGPIKTGLILGLGPVTITVNASGENIKEVSKTATGFVIFIFTSVK